MTTTPAPVEWRLVPVEPDARMTKRGGEYLFSSREKNVERLSSGLWSAMCAASPAPDLEGIRERVARKLAELKGHHNLEARIVLQDGGSCPVWRCYLDDADAILSLIFTPEGEGRE